jgi:hypothetical protein
MFIRQAGLLRRISILGAVIVSILLLSPEQTSHAFIQRADTFPSIYLPITQNGNDSDLLCRFGVNATSSVEDYPLDSLRVGWYMNFGANTNPPRPGGMHYTPVIRLCPSDLTPQELRYSCYPSTFSAEQIRLRVLANPGSDWLIGNEPDRPDHKLTGQDAVMPDDYARYYHELYTLIKETDSSARLFAGSIVQPTPVRLKYLDLILKAYREQWGGPMPVDGWNIHNYILNEKSCRHYPSWECWGADIPPGVDDTSGLIIDAQQNDDFELFTKQMVTFRAWMAQNGYRNTPLYLSEYGVLMPQGAGFDPDFDDERVNKFMSLTFHYLLTTVDAATGYPADGNRLVQRFSWYSTTDSAFNGRLFDPDTKQMTPIGSHFADYTAPIALETDYYPLSVYSTSAVSAGEPTTVTVKARIANSGNTQATYPASVRFYVGDPASGGEPIGAEQVVSLQGCGETQTVEAEWPNAPTGSHQIYVTVTAMNTSVAETNQINNTDSGLVIVDPKQLFAPLISR